METERIEMQYTDGGKLLGRYPWHLLDAPGKRVELHGRLLDPMTVQTAASAWGKRNGVVLITAKTGVRSICIYRPAEVNDGEG